MLMYSMFIKISFCFLVETVTDLNKNAGQYLSEKCLFYASKNNLSTCLRSVFRRLVSVVGDISKT